jgi:hypothetical protein
MFKQNNKGLLFMHNSIDYHSSLLARKLYRESQAQAAQQEPSTPVTLEDIIPATDTQADLLAYEVFSNSGCGCVNGKELLHSKHAAQDYWFSFYPPQAHLLPQHENLNKLRARGHELHRSRATAYAPRLFMLTVLILMFALGLLTHNALLPLLSLILVLFIWIKTQASIQENHQHLVRNQTWLQQQQNLVTALAQQCQALTQLTQTLEAKPLQQNYTYQLETWLQDSINEFFPSLTRAELKTQLETGEFNFFLLESRAILQLLAHKTNPSQEALQALLRAKGKGLFALQPFTQLEGLSRLHYLYALLCFEQGIVVCTAFYDWVTNDLYSVQEDYHPYRAIMDIQHASLRPSNHNPIPDYLSNELFQQQIKEPLQMVALGLHHQREYPCVLSKIPLHRRTYLQLPQLFFTHYLKRDICQMLATLTQHSVVSSSQLNSNQTCICPCSIRTGKGLSCWCTQGPRIQRPVSG